MLEENNFMSGRELTKSQQYHFNTILDPFMPSEFVFKAYLEFSLDAVIKHGINELYA